MHSHRGCDLRTRQSDPDLRHGRGGQIRLKPLIGITSDFKTGREEPTYFLRARYAEAIRKQGGLPVILSYTDDSKSQERLISTIDGLLITGSGPDLDPRLYGEPVRYRFKIMNPARAGFELTLIQKAVSKNLPVLGICGGHQALNVALGGTLVQDIGRDIQKALSHRESRHAIEILPGTRLYEILGRKRLMVNSYHHQAPRDPARGLRINARTSDGVIEGLEGTNGGFLLGVQWHPEYLDSPFNRRLFSAFIKETRG